MGPDIMMGVFTRALSLVLILLALLPSRGQDVTSKVIHDFELTARTHATVIRNLPVVVMIRLVPPKLHDTSTDNLTKIEKQEKALLRQLKYAIPLVDIYHPFPPVSLSISDNNKHLVRQPSIPGPAAFSEMSQAVSGQSRPRPFLTAVHNRMLCQYVDVSKYYYELNEGQYDNNIYWYRNKDNVNGYRTGNVMRITYVSIGHNDELLLKPAIEATLQRKHGNQKHDWLKSVLDYGLIRDKLSQQAKEQLALHGYLCAVLKAKKISYTPVHWLNDLPDFMRPLALTIRYEVALAENKTKDAEELEKQLMETDTGLYWENDRIKAGKGMLANILNRPR